MQATLEKREKNVAEEKKGGKDSSAKAAPKKARATTGENANKGRIKKNFRKNVRRGARRERAKPEFDQKIIKIRRVTRVVAGGRRFSFSVAIVIGNRKGSVGVGIGKATDTALAIEKAARDAKKSMITLKLPSDKSIAHEVEAKYRGAWVKIFPAKGRGLSAGSSVRVVLELAGIKNVGAKILSRSKNQLNTARAAIKALGQLSKK